MNANHPAVTQPTTQQLIDLQLAGFKEALVNRLTAEFLHQERVLEGAKRGLAEARRDLEACKEEILVAERVRRDLEERFEQERQALKAEIRRLRECGMQGGEARLEREKQTLNGGIFQLKPVVTVYD